MFQSHCTASVLTNQSRSFAPSFQTRRAHQPAWVCRTNGCTHSWPLLRHAASSWPAWCRPARVPWRHRDRPDTSSARSCPENLCWSTLEEVFTQVCDRCNASLALECLFSSPAPLMSTRRASAHSLRPSEVRMPMGDSFSSSLAAILLILSS